MHYIIYRQLHILRTIHKRGLREGRGVMKKALLNRIRGWKGGFYFSQKRDNAPGRWDVNLFWKKHAIFIRRQLSQC